MAHAQETRKKSGAGRLTLFDFDSAPVVSATGVALPPTGSKGAMKAYEGLQLGGAGDGVQARLLYMGKGDRPFSLLHSYFKPGRVIPRHSHDTDCLYSVTFGEIHMGSRCLRPGDGFFVPAEASYGFSAGSTGAEVLEFRTAARFNQTVKDQAPEQWEALLVGTMARRDGWRKEIVPPSRRG